MAILWVGPRTILRNPPSISIFLSISTYLCISIYLCVYVYVCSPVFVLYVCAFVRTYVCVCLCNCLRLFV